MLSALLVGCNQQQTTENKEVKKVEVVKPTTEAEKQSYALGAMFSTRLIKDTGNVGPDALNYDMLKQGFIDGVDGKSVFTDEEISQHMAALQQTMQKAMQEKQQQEVAVNKTAGEEHINKLKAEDSEIKAAESGTGLYYKVIEKGDAESFPEATDVVKVHYTGTLIDGTEFDSSVKRGQPAEFPLNRVISGWTEGLQLMSKGAKYRFYIPSDLAYGDQGRPGSIPPGATLIFDVELIDINPEASAEAPKDSHEHAKAEKKTEEATQ